MLPTYARQGGALWADDFARLSAAERQTIITRLTVARSRYYARRAGRPEPIFCEVVVTPSDGGGYAVDPTQPARPLRKEWGGNSDNTERFNSPTVDTPALRAAVTKLQAQMDKAKRRAR